MSSGIHKCSHYEGSKIRPRLQDISMPQMNGMDATRQIQATKCELGLNSAEVIALTGLANAQAHQDAF
ncbi:uncharacterized protein BDZ99DRAFT_373420 [Mytilinidion resinicola]|uniref:Uncharacterized protein n=1 Tax=Mytilinidion resinicola TaxID=574789 RepID=A0A6A6Z9X8_9PEZI|nr:uncharacterized protein BDZ99DRAFT_373420 [Mytilinidion resinicola]KAF2817932.1 hypothetical protein BDZ99DRAFT_373420 [Mytilinidion resinicola]